jgi:hypothetical protein
MLRLFSVIRGKEKLHIEATHSNQAGFKILTPNAIIKLFLFKVE